uniref:Secreted protein n=1 Tax=Arion vulgaris TaxID=1028688 RepID=A0A0B7BB95_9EUPU
MNRSLIHILLALGHVSGCWWMKMEMKRQLSMQNSVGNSSVIYSWATVSKIKQGILILSIHFRGRQHPHFLSFRVERWNQEQSEDCSYQNILKWEGSR